jgi:calcineurin-like phosphoesterase family protein
VIFFTSDTHFQHERVLQFSKRPFGSVAEMNDALLRNWQATVTDMDTVYHLGDVAWKWNPETRAILAQLPGVKHLLIGNHDHKHVRNAPIWASVQTYIELKVELPDGSQRLIVLCHYPFAVWRDSHHGSINLHGHSHGSFPASRQQMDVGVDCTDYAPIALPAVLERLKSFDPHAHCDAHKPGEEDRDAEAQNA